jgi:hypothetical protein
MTRQRKPRINLFGYENDQGVVIRTENPNKWFIKCKSCGEEHEQTSREIQRNQKVMSCKNYKPHNWTGVSKEDGYIRRNYGITLDQYHDLLVAQSNGCAICGRTQEPDGRRLAIDHCHVSGNVRGILCNNCNNGLGSFGDSIEGMQKAIDYLKNPPFQNALAR